MTDRATGEMPWDGNGHAFSGAAPLPSLLDPALPPAETTTRECGRCRKPHDSAAPRCPTCGARNPDATATSQSHPRAGGTASAAPDARPSDLRPFAVVMWTFAALLLQSVLFAVIAAAGGHGDFGVTSQLTWISILEAVDTVLVFLAAMMLWNIASPRDSRRPLLAWVGAWPALAAALAINLGYHRWFEGFGIATQDLPIDQQDPRMIAWAFATVCIQPALVEEWFFRGLAWKTFRDHMGPHGTVWVIAVMFGLAHVGAFLSVPVLILVGALLGYARLYSGGIALPILLHFVHNLVVSLWDAWK